MQLILFPLAETIKSLTFVTGPKFSKSLLQKTQELLNQKNALLSVHHRTTKLFHDRFWIVDYSRGIFVGTSLNGLGKRYALSDYMQENDVSSIVEELRKNDLI